MRTFILLFCGGLLAGSQAAAQQTFNGYYINNNGDTATVTFPGYRQWKNNPAHIPVQTTGGQDVVLTPENTREFAITGYDTYRSRRFTRLVNPAGHMNSYNSLAATDSLEEIHGFLLFLTQAKGVSLYKYSDKKRDNFFIQKGDSLVELKHKIFQKDNGEVGDDNTFRQQLSHAFELEWNGTPALKARLERLEYTEEKLAGFLQQMGGQKIKKEKRYPAEFYLVGGVAFNGFHVDWWDYQSPASEASYNSGLGPVAGLAFYEYSQRGFGRNFLTGQLKYYRYSNTGTYAYGSRQGKVTFSSGLLNLGAGLGRNFIQTPVLTAYAAAVPQMVYLPDSKEKYTDAEGDNKKTVLTFNGSLQAGVRLRGGVGWWAHYNLLPFDTRNNPFFVAQHRSLQLGVDLQLKKKRP